MNLQLGRRHRAVTLSLALIAAGLFLLFVTRVFLSGFPKPPLRTCTPSELYQGMTFDNMQRQYHWTMEQLVEERMQLYEGKTLLQCSEKAMTQVIPPGTLASTVASVLPFVPDPPDFTYGNFERLLSEFFRTYDCHLFSLQQNPALLAIAFRTPIVVPPTSGDISDVASSTLFSGVEYVSRRLVGQERIRARRTLDRLLFTLRSSEEYLPLHASLRCLQRGSTDVRNAMALLGDANQCAPIRLSQPETSLLKP